MSESVKTNGERLGPFVKWAGGKGQLLREIRCAFPDGLGTSISKYAEPFVGGGAVLFDVLDAYSFDSVYISDINHELIATYKAIRDDVDHLVALLNSIQDEFIPLTMDKRKEYFYSMRTRFNGIISGANTADKQTECAALFIFLNRTCFNGLYRVNSKGLYNVPPGVYKNPLICDEANLRNLSTRLQGVTIVCGDYKESDSFIDEKTFVYFDPPYRPLTETASFTSYTSNGFGDTEQRELADFVDKISQRGAKVVVSNSDPKNTNSEDDFFDNLYSKHRINRVKAVRMINCNGQARGKINELLICSK